MRPGRGPEGDPDLGFALQIGRKSVRAADHENSLGDGLVPPLPEPAGERGTVDVFAALIERDKYGVFRDCGRDRGGLFGDSRRCLACTAFADLADV
jgi:hypothetical protein